MSVSNKTNYNKKEKDWKKKKKTPVSCHAYLILFATIFNAILFKKVT